MLPTKSVAVTVLRYIPNHALRERDMQMKTMTYPVGTKLKLVRGTMLWGQEHVRGRCDLLYEVVCAVDDGSSMERISVRAIGEQELAFIGITPDLFERAEPAT